MHGFENIVDIVIYVLVTRNQSNNMSLPTDKALKSNLSNVNAYAMRLVRWLLEKIENRNNPATLDMSNLSIEHIMPAPFVLELSEWYYFDKVISEEQYFEIINVVNGYQLRRYFNGDDTSRVSKAFPS